MNNLTTIKNYPIGTPCSFKNASGGIILGYVIGYSREMDDSESIICFRVQEIRQYVSASHYLCHPQFIKPIDYDWSNKE